MSITMDNAQLMKGILEGCVLGIIERGETYGYEILSVLEDCGFINVGEGTLYPVISRLDKNGYISCRKAKSPLGPVRKYYSITEKGLEYFEQFKISYKRITESAEKAIFNAE